MDRSVPGIRHDEMGAWLVEHVGVEPPFAFHPITGGNSNLTFRVTTGTDRELAVRRPPLGHVLETAHDVAREFRVISALGSTAVPVPPALALCEDVSVNDAPFYVMEFVQGVVPHDADGGALIPEHERQSVGRSAVDVLAALHSLDPDDVGLGNLGRREDYLARQLRRWARQWEASKQRDIPEMDVAHSQLEQRIPEQRRSTIVHGDYRLGNMIVRDGGVSAVLDWELCTLGDPLADLGYLLNSWLDPDDPVVWRSAATQAGGFGSRQDVIDRYADQTGADLSDIAYYQAFQAWRLGAILEGVYARYRHGAMGSTEGIDLDVMAGAVVALARDAVSLLDV